MSHFNKPTFLGTPTMSQVEVARTMGVTKNVVYQIEKRALRKLRKILVRRLGPEYFDIDTNDLSK